MELSATINGITIPENTSQDEWKAIHLQIITCKKAASKWLSQSRKFAVDHWGIDYAAETEVQLELSLGIERKEIPARLNPSDKSKAIVTIEGIHQSFKLWNRKMSPEIETWDKTKLERALQLLEPMVQEARRIEQILAKNGTNTPP